jgi:lysophospholipase L1-like esterase
MTLRRIMLSIGLITAAVVAGATFSLRPITATAQPDTIKRYVALGDSVAAGAGLPLASNADAEAQLCARSPQGYPNMVAQRSGLLLQNLTCSGAKVDEGIYGSQRVADSTIPAQLDRAFAHGTPDVLTITIGANDARWSQFVGQCVRMHCGSFVDDARVTAYLLDLRLELYMTLYKIWQHSNGHPPQVLFTGYYDPLNGNTCAAAPGVTAAESAWLSNKAASLNSAIRTTVLSSGLADFVAIDFSGHDLCSEDSWIQGLNDPAPSHPNAAGQEAIAAAVANAITAQQ